MPQEHRKDDGLGRISVLEAILPRIEKELKEDVKFIRDNMATKTELQEMILPIQAATNDNKKKVFWLQVQVISLGAFFVIDLFIGASKTLGVAASVGSKFIIP